MTPYNTGRVRIGCAYIPPPMPIRTLDAYRLQSALLEPRTAQPMGMMRRMLAVVWRWL